MAGGMHGRAIHGRGGACMAVGLCVVGACLAGGMCGRGGMHGRGVHGRETCVKGEKTTAAEFILWNLFIFFSPMGCL